jgi:hypothetical protein
VLSDPAVALEEVGMANNHYSPLIALCTALAVLLVDVSVSGCQLAL